MGRVPDEQPEAEVEEEAPEPKECPRGHGPMRLRTRWADARAHPGNTVPARKPESLRAIGSAHLAEVPGYEQLGHIPQSARRGAEAPARCKSIRMP